MDGKLLGDMAAIPVLLVLYGIVRLVEWLF